MKKAEAISILATSVRPREAKDRARYDEAVKMAIEALKRSETPNSSDCISRQAAIDALHMHLMYRMGTDSNKKRLDEWINNLPSAQPEAKPPKWVAEDRYVKNRFAVFPHCPRCNAGITTGQCYCMICGQHIDWSEDDG